MVRGTQYLKLISQSSKFSLLIFSQCLLSKIKLALSEQKIPRLLRKHGVDYFLRVTFCFIVTYISSKTY